MSTEMTVERESCRLRKKLMIEKREFEPPRRLIPNCRAAEIPTLLRR